MRAIIFDIETGPLEREILDELLPAFSEEDVALGNVKDPEKIRERIESARRKHAESFYDQAALAARTGEVLAIGYRQFRTSAPLLEWQTAQTVLLYNALEGGPSNLPSEFIDRKIQLRGAVNEKEMLEVWWNVVCSGNTPLLVGFNSHDFDLPFLLQRSLANSVPAPPIRRGHRWSDYCIDLKEVWACGSRGPCSKGRLDDLARFVGAARKTGDGALFHEHFRADEKTRQEAMAYLANDIDMTVGVAWRLHTLTPLHGQFEWRNPWFSRPRWNGPEERTVAAPEVLKPAAVDGPPFDEGGEFGPVSNE